MASKTIIIASGGTGGHLYPTIAVADEIHRLDPSINIIFIGTSDRIEAREVPRAGYDFRPINIEAPKKSLKSALTFPFKLGKAILDCLLIMNKEKPRAMLGGGAYLSVPVGVAAWAFHVPIALLEINSISGSANRLLSRLADKLFLAYPESQKTFPARASIIATVSGTPVRGTLGIDPISPEEGRKAFGLDPGRKTLLVFGGSLGARAINQAIEKSAKQFVNAGYNIIWQTGKGNNAEALKAQFNESQINPSNISIQEYIYEMEKAYAAADLVVCRAGASSLAELERLGKPAILVPYPYAAQNHQEANAQAFEAAGAALVIRDTELGEQLERSVLELMNDENRRSQMAEHMLERENKAAANIVAEWLIAKCA